MMLVEAGFTGPSVVRWSDIAAAWLLTYLVHSTIVLIGVWALTSLRRMGNATREVLWRAALVGGLVTSSVQGAAGHEPLAGQLALATRAADVMARVIRVDVHEDGGGGIARGLVVARPTGMPWTAMFVTFWLTAAGTGLLWMTVAHGRAARRLADRQSLEGTAAALRLRRLLAHAGVRRHVELTCSGSIASPLALPGGEVCLPRRALLELEPPEQDSMLAHEAAHVVRRDPLWLIAARIIETVLFLQPLNRLARHRMQESAEFLCDDWAIERTNEPVTLAKCLATVAEWAERAPRLHPVSAMVESRGSPLVRRVGRILASQVDRRARSSRGALAACACGLLVLAVGAPRVTVAHGLLANRTMTLVREIAHREMPGREIGARGMPDREIRVRTMTDRQIADGSIAARGIARRGVATGMGGRDTLVFFRANDIQVMTDSVVTGLIVMRRVESR